MNYSVAIRTLGKAGEKYQKLLCSLRDQTIQPDKIVVYIAEGYPQPKETIGIESYVWVAKGMVAQRALQYDEIDSEYVLFLDDDVYLPPNAVETLYKELVKMGGDVISPDVFPNNQRSLKSKLMMALSGRMLPHRDDGIWAYKVMRSGGYYYNDNPKDGTYQSQTNAGPCFFCKKKDFLKIHFEEELWMDKMRYALGEDAVMFYKMHCLCLDVLTVFGSGIVHLDAGSTNANVEKERTLVYADLYFKTVFWYRFFFNTDNVLFRIWDAMCIAYPLVFSFGISIVKGRLDMLKLKYSAIKDAVAFIYSEEYKMIPKIKKVRR